ncbi:unnamed protein product [Chrysoparadoxa australica]
MDINAANAAAAAAVGEGSRNGTFPQSYQYGANSSAPAGPERGIEGLGFRVGKMEPDDDRDHYPVPPTPVVRMHPGRSTQHRAAWNEQSSIGRISSWGAPQDTHFGAPYVQPSNHPGAATATARSSSLGEDGVRLSENWTKVLGSVAGPELVPFLSEQESHALALWNVSHLHPRELALACQKYGSVQYLRTDFRQHGVVFLAYFDLRAAVQAQKNLAYDMGPPPASFPASHAHFMLPLHAASSCRESAVVMRDVPSQVSEADIAVVLQRFGSVKSVRRQPSTSSSPPVLAEFFNVNDAKTAVNEWAACNPWDARVDIKPAARGEKEKLLGRQLLATLNRWRCEASQYQRTSPYSDSGPGLGREEREVSISSNGTCLTSLSGYTSDADSPPPSMDMDGSLAANAPTPLVSAHSTPLSTPGSTPPSGADAYQYVISGGKVYQQSTRQQQQQAQQLVRLITPSGVPLYTQAGTPVYPAHGFYVELPPSYPSQSPSPGSDFSRHHHRHGHSHNSSPSASPVTPVYGSHYSQVVHIGDGGGGHPTSSSHPPTPCLSSGPGSHSSLPRSGREEGRRPRRDSGGDTEFSLDVHKVLEGIDKRTTVMIRNIPNKYTQRMLLDEIDIQFRGSYDFFYLPIDFKNKCNVGYAFINFLDPVTIVKFYKECDGKRWANFNSEKVCAISYARIQGKSSMISRFQNSSLMEKDDEYRPLLFYSGGPEKGCAEPFPLANKARRSSTLKSDNREGPASAALLI